MHIIYVSLRFYHYNRVHWVYMQGSQSKLVTSGLTAVSQTNCDRMTSFICVQLPEVPTTANIAQTLDQVWGPSKHTFLKTADL